MAEQPGQLGEQPGETVPLEVHVVALRVELERARQVQQVATGALLAVALLLLWQTLHGGGAG